MSYLIRLDEVTIGYDNNGILNPIDLTIDRGRFWGVIGPNGGGKSTLLKTVLGLIPPVSGIVQTQDGLAFGYVPQKDKFDPIFPVSVDEVVTMGRYSRIPPGRRPGKADKERVRHALTMTGIIHLKNRTFRSLSEGEKQRALLARAIAGDPDVLVLDEPTASVDVKGEARIMELVVNIKQEQGLTVIMVSHYLNTLKQHADMMMLIDKDRTIFEAGTKEKMMNSASVKGFFGMKPGETPVD
jgi:zinc transport system ATP-binding protein